MGAKSDTGPITYVAGVMEFITKGVEGTECMYRAMQGNSIPLALLLCNVPLIIPERLLSTWYASNTFFLTAWT